MEVNGARRTRRLETASRPAAGTMEKSQAKSGARTTGALGRMTRKDRLALSQAALSMLEEQNRRAKEELERRKLEMAYNSGKSETDAATKALKAMQRCQRIAARIMAGDKVPPEDEKYLQDNDMQGYQLAMAMRKPKKDPKEWESVLEEEEKEQACGEESGEEASVSAAEDGGSSAEV